MTADTPFACLAPAGLGTAESPAEEAPGMTGPQCPVLPAGQSQQASAAEVYDLHGDYVWRCLRGLGVAPSQLDDAVQDVFIVVHQKLHAFDGACALRTWLYAIVIRVARRQRALHARNRAPEAKEPPDLRTSERAFASKQALAQAQAALETLDQDKREVFVLSEIEQMSGPEIATVLDTPLNTVYSRLRAARRAFDVKLEQLSRSSRRWP